MTADIGFMIDMDGTVYKGGSPIPGAKGFVDFLRSEGIPFVFLTNNSCRARPFYCEKLRSMGFDVGPENILTSNTATIRYILSQRPGRSVYVVGAPDVVGEVGSAGIHVTEDYPDIVYLSFDRTITYDKINRAYRAIIGGAELIATHPDDLCPAAEGYDIDIGPFIRMFEQMCGVEATVIGKPNRLMLEMAALEMGVRPESTVMVGDRLYTDIKMGNMAGTSTILVLTGEATREDLRSSEVVPTYVLDSVGDIPGIIDGLFGRSVRTRFILLYN